MNASSPLVGVATVWVVSPSTSLRRALAAMVARQPALALAGDSATVQAARLALAERPVDVVISSLPPAGAAEVPLWREVRDLGVRLIVMSPYLNSMGATLSILAGASAVLELGVGRGAALMARVDEVARGRSALPAEAVQRLLEIAASRQASLLAPDERRLLVSLLSNETLRDIAAAAKIDLANLRVSLAGICEKLSYGAAKR